MKLSDFDYDLPSERIAQVPLQRRDASRLMVVDRSTRMLQHTNFEDIGDFIPESSLLILNDTKVIPARLVGSKNETGARVELLLIEEKTQDTWEVLGKPMRRLKVGTRLVFGEGVLTAVVLEMPHNGNCIVKFEYDGSFFSLLSEIGLIPLPPYIRRQPTDEDNVRYQSVYACKDGAIAAPTAGLHFTEDLLEILGEKGIQSEKLTLHVGIGTFKPVKVEDVKSHKMHAEYICINDIVAERISNSKRTGTSVVAVGTTVVRALETAGKTGTVKPYNGHSDLFIYPGFKFNIVDALLTNFHLPKSTLLMLVSAFADTSLIQKAYQEALQEKYRFYSYGDAMLIL